MPRPRKGKVLVTCSLEGCKRQKYIQASKLNYQEHFFCCKEHQYKFWRENHPWHIRNRNNFKNKQRSLQ
jgi:hypothetical protein